MLFVATIGAPACEICGTCEIAVLPILQVLPAPTYILALAPSALI